MRFKVTFELGHNDDMSEWYYKTVFCDGAPELKDAIYKETKQGHSVEHIERIDK